MIILSNFIFSLIFEPIPLCSTFDPNIDGQEMPCGIKSALYILHMQETLENIPTAV